MKARRSHNDRPTLGSGLDAILLVSLITLFAIYVSVTIRAFVSLPPIPSDLTFAFDESSDYRRDYGRALQAAEVAALHGLRQDGFPQSIRRDIFETINHPGAEVAEKKIPLRVPPFWDPPMFESMGGVRQYLGAYGTRPMTKEEALSIGSRVPVALDGGEDDPMLETIYVAVASYRDWQCPKTVESIFSRAKYPHRVRVAVVDQLDQSDAKCSEPAKPCEEDNNQVLCLHKDRIDFFEMDANLAVGPVFARHLGHRMYRGEYFAMQSDAHVSFVQDWDVDIIEQWKSANNEMAVLSTYLSDVQGSIDEKTGKSLRDSRPIMCKSGYEGGGTNRHLRHGQQPEGVPGIHGTPTINPYWAAGFSFSRGHFVVNIPYDQHLPMIFQGEEISMGLRGFSYGYDYYSPERSVCFHMYAVGKNKEKRGRVPLFWEHSNLFAGVGQKAMARLNGIIHMNPEVDPKTWLHDDQKKYGIGNVRDLQKFFETFGIHTETKKVENHLCRFVGKPMQREFIPHLRENGMGINYDEIDYKFVDKWKDEDR